MSCSVALIDSVSRSATKPEKQNQKRLHLRSPCYNSQEYETLGIAPQAEHIRWTIAASGSIVLARAAFDAAVKELPHECFPLRNRIMLMSEYPQKNNWRRASVFFVRLERG
jgi:hypothetical protein